MLQGCAPWPSLGLEVHSALAWHFVRGKAGKLRKSKLVYAGDARWHLPRQGPDHSAPSLFSVCARIILQTRCGMRRLLDVEVPGMQVECVVDLLCLDCTRQHGSLNMALYTS